MVPARVVVFKEGRAATGLLQVKTLHLTRIRKGVVGGRIGVAYAFSMEGDLA